MAPWDDQRPIDSRVYTRRSITALFRNRARPNVEILFVASEKLSAFGERCLCRGIITTRVSNLAIRRIVVGLCF
jgi:hypothetical protein